MRKLALILAILAAPAFAGLMAVLQSQTQVQTVTGQVAWRCVYQIPGGRQFVMLAPLGQMCAPSVMVD